MWLPARYEKVRNEVERCPTVRGWDNRDDSPQFRDTNLPKEQGIAYEAALAAHEWYEQR